MRVLQKAGCSECARVVDPAAALTPAGSMTTPCGATSGAPVLLVLELEGLDVRRLRATRVSARADDWFEAAATAEQLAEYAPADLAVERVRPLRLAGDDVCSVALYAIPVDEDADAELLSFLALR